MSPSSMRLDRWEITDVDPGAAPSDAADWLPITAPGDVYQALVAAGRLDHPYKARNEHAAASVRDREWRWRTTFVAPEAGVGETVELAFDGLDTFADDLSRRRRDRSRRQHVPPLGLPDQRPPEPRPDPHARNTFRTHGPRP